VQSRFSDIKFSGDLVFCKDHFSIYYVKSFDLVTIFAEIKSVTKSRLHCIYYVGELHLAPFVMLQEDLNIC
jgi:hypothetical protein